MSAVAPLLAEAGLVEPDVDAREGYPHDRWTALRRDDPVHHVERDHEPFWAITRHADIVLVGLLRGSV